MRERLIRIPRSSGRNATIAFARLLRHVSRDARTGYHWDGRLLRPGALVEASVLRSDDSYPQIPILLECAGTVRPHGALSNRWPAVYILWRFEADSWDWKEIARATGYSWEWAVDLAPIAERLLAEARSTALVEIDIDPLAVTARVSSLLDAELAVLREPDRIRVLCALHDVFASRLSAAM